MKNCFDITIPEEFIKQEEQKQRKLYKSLVLENKSVYEAIADLAESETKQTKDIERK